MPDKLAFEFGFDWNTNTAVGYQAGVYPLQLYAVDLEDDSLRSLANPSDLCVDDALRFRIYDFSSPIDASSPRPQPLALQVLFSDGVATDAPRSGRTFSPLQDSNGQQVSQLIFTELEPVDVPSRGFGVPAGWEARMGSVGESTLKQPGRFQFRALLTVSIPGAQARFYRIDPEMVVGPGPGG